MIVQFDWFQLAVLAYIAADWFYLRAIKGF